MKKFVLIAFALLLGATTASVQAGEKATYEGAKVCAKCHDLQGEAWQATGHAKAFDLLKPGVRAEAKTKAKIDPNKDYSADPGCLECHTTGFGEAGGYDIAMPPAQAKGLAGVGCESCTVRAACSKKSMATPKATSRRAGPPPTARCWSPPARTSITKRPA